MTDSGSHPNDDARWKRLTEKQRACLDLLLERQTSKEIARRLNISKQAVDLRLTTARDILGARNRDDTANIYSRLRQTYDQMPCDPVVLPVEPQPVAPGFPDGGSSDLLELEDCSRRPAEPDNERSPSGKFWRHDHAASARVTIITAGLLALVLIALGGISIAETLTRLVSS